MEEHGDGRIVDELAFDKAEPELEVGVGAPRARVQEAALACLDHPLGHTEDPERRHRQDQQEPLHALGLLQMAALPPPADALEVAKQFLLPGSSAVLRTSDPGSQAGQSPAT